LALPIVNLDDYQSSLEVLHQSRDQITEANSHYAPEVMQEFYKLMYPLDWLAALGSLEAQRRVLLTTPNPKEKDIRAYQRKLEYAMSAHTTYITQLVNWYRTYPEVLTDASHGVHHFEGFTSFDYALRNLTHYRLEMEQQKMRAQNRFDCYLGKTSCIEVTVPPLTPVKEFAPEQYSQDLYDIVHAVRKEFGGEHPYGHNLVRLSSSACSLQSKGIYYHLWRTTYLEGQTHILKADPLDDVLVHVLDDEILENSHYHQAYKELGGTNYEMQSLGNYYVCPDIVADVTRIQSLLYLYTTLKNQDVFSDQVITNSKLQQRVAQIQQARNTILESDVVDEYTGYQYARQLWLLLHEFPAELLEAELGRDTTNLLAEQLLTYRLGTFDLSTLINSVANDNSAIASYAPFGQWNYIDYFLVLRSAPSLLLGGSNQSIIPTNVSWIQDQGDEAALTKYKSYPNDLANDISLEELIDALIMSKKVNNQLLEQSSTTNQ